MIKLGVNIDHVATIRNARGEGHPDVLKAAKESIKAGADSITVHLREDRRHIKDRDLKKISSINFIKLNLEMSATKNMLKIALKSNPDYVCIVPEKRNEITTEGGLNLKKNFNRIKQIIKTLNKKKIRTSLFINPSINDIKLANLIGAKCVEIHTGAISRKIKNKNNYNVELTKISKCAKFAAKNNIEVHAGHGMDYNVAKKLSKIIEIKEFNIGHFIIGESIFHGLNNVIKTFKKIIK